MRAWVSVVVLISGCVGFEEPALDERAAPLVVCGSSVQAAIDAAPPDAVLEICAGTYAERLVVNGKRVELRGAGASVTIVDAASLGRALTVRDTTVTVTGLTLRNGLTASSGGGVSCVAGGLRMRDSAVTDNRAAGGGGLAADGCLLDLAAVHFEGNDAGAGRGGGALVSASSGVIAASGFVANRAEEGGGLAIVGGSVEVADNQLRGNSAHRGGGLFLGHDGWVHGNQIVGNEGRWTAGGLYVDNRAPTIEGNLIDQNTSVNDGGGCYAHQGAPVFLDNVVTANTSGDDGGGVRLFESRARLERNVIERNHADDSGGGVRVSHLPALLVDNVIRDNRATLGGGLDLDNDASVLRGGVVSGNRATSGGGIAAALYPWTGAVIEDVEITDNVAIYRGGGLYVVDNYQPMAMRHLTVRGNRAQQGAGLYTRGATHTLANSTFAHNVATGDGGAIAIAAGTTATTAELDFVVLRGNGAASGSALWSAASGVSIESSILADNLGTAVQVSIAPLYRYNDTWPPSFGGMADPTGTNGNLAAEPGFLDPGNGNYRLGAASPAIDAADPGRLDADGSRADMGRFGGPDGGAPPPPTAPIAVLEADAYVALDQPTINFGAAATIAADTAPMTEAYLRFRVTNAAAVTRARLQLTVTNGTGDAPALYAADSAWDEATIRWNARPLRGAFVADLGAVAIDTVIEYDVTSLVAGDGVYTLALVPTSSDGFAAFTREGASAPRLVLTTDAPAPGPVAVLEADTYATAVAPNTSHGSAAMLSSDTSPLEESYLRFRVSGATTVTTARLRLHVVDATSDGPALYAAASDWTEATLTWNQRPARGALVADLGAASLGQFVEYDVSSLVTGDGTFTFALVPTSSSGFAVSSREGGAAPQLIVE